MYVELKNWTTDGYQIDGNTVKFWGTRSRAKDAAKDIGWPATSIIKVFTRFQLGYALYDPAYGALTHEGYEKLSA